MTVILCWLFFFFNDPAPTEIYPLPLHDALPISSTSRSAGSARGSRGHAPAGLARRRRGVLGLGDHGGAEQDRRDRKSTRLNSSHLVISYAVFCLKKKNE